MNSLKGLRVVVAGAGAIGSVLAVSLARRGADVILADPADVLDSASAVAAGMLAPLCETLFDSLSAEHYPLLRAGRDAWPALLDGLPAPDRSGALVSAADETAAEALIHRASVLRAELGQVTAAQAARLAPGLAAPGPLLFTPEDWRLRPRAMLMALHHALEGAGGRRMPAMAAEIADGRVRFTDGSTLAADALVMATGLGRGDLRPIKGQILRFPGFGPPSGPVVRGEGIYAAPDSEGLIVGATMEQGLADRRVDPQAVQRLRVAATRLFPTLADAPAQVSVGVRAATPDGLPLAGASAAHPGLFQARGARRNGWLLAPLVAEVILDQLLGRPPSRAALAFDPGRF